MIMKKFAVSLFIDPSSLIKSIIVVAKSKNDIVYENGDPTPALLDIIYKEMDYRPDPEDCFVDVISIEGDDMPSPYILN